jgi:heat shock protein HtpX
LYQQIASNKRRTWVLLLAFFFLVLALAFLLSKVYGSPGLLFFIGLASIIYALYSYFAGAKMALAVNRAKQISKADNPRLWRTVENLSLTDGLPMPQVYIMEDKAPNAFATGRDPDHSAICATTGLLDMMDDNELEGVIAHELGHIKNYDIRVNTIAFALAGVVSMIADFFWHISLFGGRDEGDNNQLLAILSVVAIVLAPIAASLIQLAISRRREYLADATGALTTRYPEGLESALQKIGQYGSTLKRQNTSTAHMFFANPLRRGSLVSLFSTHPPIEARIQALKQMEL